jgi:hypothetical protein
VNDADADAVAAELGRRYVAGHLEADELDERLGRLYAAPESAALLLDDLPRVEAATPAPVASRKSWWRRRHGESEGAQPDWLPTSERFLDPTTGRLMRVWLDPETRTRHYVPEVGSG